MSWGKGLFEACRLLTHLWQDHKNLLRTYSKPQSGQTSSGCTKSLPQSGGKGKGKTVQGVAVGNITILPQVVPGIQVNKPAQAKSKGKNGSPSGGIPQRAQTAPKTRTGLVICKSYNDSRGRDTVCPRGFLHCCDLVIGGPGKPGIACEAKPTDDLITKDNSRNHHRDDCIKACHGGTDESPLWGSLEPHLNTLNIPPTEVDIYFQAVNEGRYVIDRLQERCPYNDDRRSRNLLFEAPVGPDLPELNAARSVTTALVAQTKHPGFAVIWRQKSFLWTASRLTYSVG